MAGSPRWSSKRSTPWPWRPDTLNPESQPNPGQTHQLAWQLWCRFEVAHEAERGADAARPRLARVTLCGPKAATRKSEWDELRAPWAFPTPRPTAPVLQLFSVVAGEGDEEEVASRVLADEPDSVVVFVDDRADYITAASRLARRFPSTRPDHVRVMLRCNTGISSEPVVPGGLFRLVPGLVRTDATGATRPPRDSMTRLARQQHTVFRAVHGWPNGSTSPDGPRLGPRLTQVPWEDLPEFFQEDNVRQHWQVLSWFNQHGFIWTRVSAVEAGAPADALWRAHLEDVAVAEYRRWAHLRTTHGWWPGGSGSRDDSARVHPDVRGWQFVDLKYNERLIESILARMWATGLAPHRASPDVSGSL